MTRLTRHLTESLGRATLLEPAAEWQLCPQQGSLSNQLVRLYDAVGLHLNTLTGTHPDLPPRKPHQWTVLTEHEHPGWALLALSQPPVISADDTPLIVRHLVTAHVAMEPARCREWARQTHERDGFEPLRRALPAGVQDTWVGLVASILTVQAQHAMLHGWGVLSAYVGLHPELKIQAAHDVLAALSRDPDLLERPQELAEVTLWATLGVLHGGLPRPSAHDPQGISKLARALRSVSKEAVVAALPHPTRLYAQLRESLPSLTQPEFEGMADYLYGVKVADQRTTLQHTSGQPLTCAPGQCAYWLRRAGQVQVVTSTQVAGGGLEVRAWHWNL